MEIKEFISLTSDYSREIEKINKSDASLMIQGDRRLLLFSNHKRSNLLTWALHKHLGTGIGIGQTNIDIPDKISRLLILTSHRGDGIHVSSDSYELSVLLLNYLKRRYDTKILKFLDTETNIQVKTLTVCISTGTDTTRNIIKRFGVFNRLVPFVRNYTQLATKDMRPYLHKTCISCNHKIETRIVSKPPFNICYSCSQRIDYFAIINDLIRGDLKKLTRANIGNYSVWRRDKKTKCRVCNRMFVRNKLIKICDTCLSTSRFSIPIAMSLSNMSLDNIEKDSKFKGRFFPDNGRDTKKTRDVNDLFEGTLLSDSVALPNQYTAHPVEITDAEVTPQREVVYTITQQTPIAYRPMERSTEEEPSSNQGSTPSHESISRAIGDSFRYWNRSRRDRRERETENEDNEE